MIIKNRLAAAALAACLTVGGGIAVAAPAQAYEMVKQSFRVDKYGYSSKALCDYGKKMTAQSITASGGYLYAGDNCNYFGSTKKYGFSLTYWKWVPKPS